MTEQIKIGSTLKWTLQSPKETGVDNSGFYEFIDDNFIPEGANSHISGVVVYISDGSAIIQVTDMTSDMFPFTLFYNEVKNRFFGFEVKEVDPYQKYFCLDLTTMVSLYYYYEGEGFLASAEFDEDNHFDWYEQPDTNEGLDSQSEMGEGFDPDQINIELPAEDIESYENQEAFCSSDDIEMTDDNGDICISEGGHPCSIVRANSWFNTRDCAIITAWRGGKSRKTNDDNNRKLQRRLRELGYGVTKITGWFPEKDKEVARENSFLTVNLNDEESFRSNIYELSELYEQDSFLYKKAGRDIPAVYVHTNDDTGKGTEELAGRLRIGNMEADVYSQIKAGRITFE